MPLVNTKDLLTHAQANRYAVGAFEIVSLEFLSAVLAAAESSRSPVVLTIDAERASVIDLETLLAAVVNAAERAAIPVGMQLDHCADRKTVEAAIRLGCTSILYDNTAQSFAANVGNTKKITELAHAKGLAVEGEIGFATGVQTATDPARANDTPGVASVSEAQAYVERTGVDCLAVAVGSAPGRAKKRVKINYSRVARIRECVAVPLVMHGGSALNDEQCHKLIAHGVAKINYSTALTDLAAQEIRASARQADSLYPLLFKDVVNQVSARVQYCMQTWGSAGRAAEVLLQCRPWRPTTALIGREEPGEDVIDTLGVSASSGRQVVSRLSSAHPG